MNEGLRLACIYNWNCETARMLKVSEFIYNFAVQGNPRLTNSIKGILKEMGPSADYCSIAHNLKLQNIFDPRVIRAYWRCWGLSKKAPAWHNYSVLSQLKNVPFGLLNVEKINECLVFSGKIVGEKNGNWIIKYRPVIKTKTRLCFESYKLKEVRKIFTARAKKEDIISFHFSADAEIISREESRQLNEATNEALKIFNARIL